jgi:cyclopropane-fatty-acyl-phospholipid synthase
MKARAEIEAMYDARFYRLWEFYLAGGIVMFENGAGCNYQIQFIRDRRALPLTRDYMAEAEQKYREAGAEPINAPRKPRGAGRKKALESAQA